MDVSNESIQIKCFLKRNHVCTQMRLGLVQAPAYSICRYRVFYGGMECSGTAEWSRKLYQHKKVQVGKDQEKAQSEKNSHSKNQGGKKPN